MFHAVFLWYFFTSHISIKASRQSKYIQPQKSQIRPENWHPRSSWLLNTILFHFDTSRVIQWNLSSLTPIWYRFCFFWIHRGSSKTSRVIQRNLSSLTPIWYFFVSFWYIKGHPKTSRVIQWNLSSFTPIWHLFCFILIHRGSSKEI